MTLEDVKRAGRICLKWGALPLFGMATLTFFIVGLGRCRDYFDAETNTAHAHNCTPPISGACMKADGGWTGAAPDLSVCDPVVQQLAEAAGAASDLAYERAAKIAVPVVGIASGLIGSGIGLYRNRRREQIMNAGDDVQQNPAPYQPVASGPSPAENRV